MSVEFNAENRNAIPSRCCSFCRRTGHNITRCDSEPIRMFERNTLDYIYLILPLELQGRSQLEDINRYLLNEALYDSNLVRAFAISRCGANTRSNMASCIQLIIQYFTPHIQTAHQTASQSVETPHTSLPQPMPRLGRRFGFSESIYYGTGFQGLLSRDNESLLYAMMFLEMIRSNNESNSLNRKFDIKTSVLENPVNLEQKCECGICYEECETKNFIKLNCGHEFCKDCIKQTLQNERRLTPCCAFCRTDIKNFELKLESVKNEFNELIESDI